MQDKTGNTSRAAALVSRINGSVAMDERIEQLMPAVAKLSYRPQYSKATHRGETGDVVLHFIYIRVPAEELRKLGDLTTAEYNRLEVGGNNYALIDDTLMDIGSTGDYHSEYEGEDLPFSPVVYVNHPAVNKELTKIFKRKHDFPVLDEAEDWDAIVRLKRKAGYVWSSRDEEFVSSKKR